MRLYTTVPRVGSISPISVRPHTTLNMYTHFIAGVPKSPDFGHVVYIAEKLKRSLTYWSYEVLAKTEEEYLVWQQQFCKERNWTINKNPLVWKRISNSNGPYHLIGGINEFFEMLKEYYNIDPQLDKDLKMKIAKDNSKKMEFILATRASAVHQVMPRGVCLTGVIYPSSSYLISELLQLKQLHTESGISIYLHHCDRNKYGDLRKIKTELSEVEFNIRGHKALTVVNNIEECLPKCDLLIVMGDAKGKEDDEKSEKQRRDQNYNDMRCLASILNRHCPEFCKVILMDMDMLCFNLSVLAEYAHKVYLYNIVGVTGHHGMRVLPTISEATGIPISDLHCPPVWGFIGVKKYIDWYHTVYHHKCSKSAACGEANDNENQICHKYIKSKAGFDMNEMINGSDEHNPVESKFLLSYSPEVRAAVTMISEWFQSENKTISAAIFSDGTFGLPFGMFISQQVYLDNGEWKPDSDYLSPDKHILKDIVSKAVEIVIEYDLGKRYHKYSNMPKVWWKRATDSLDLGS